MAAELLGFSRRGRRLARLTTMTTLRTSSEPIDRNVADQSPSDRTYCR